MRYSLKISKTSSDTPTTKHTFGLSLPVALHGSLFETILFDRLGKQRVHDKRSVIVITFIDRVELIIVSVLFLVVIG